MTELEKLSQKDDSTKSREAPPESRNLTTRGDLSRRLKRSHDARTSFVDSHINKTLAFQIRSLRGNMSQEKAMEKLGMNQNAISRLENPYYGKATLTTLKRIAAAFDVGLLVEFVPFSQLVKRVSGTPYVERGLSPDTMNVPSFDQEEEQGTFDAQLDETAQGQVLGGHREMFPASAGGNIAPPSGELEGEGMAVPEMGQGLAPQPIPSDYAPTGIKPPRAYLANPQEVQ
jgi:transcriptional regulator with XRE-family HTH domain